MHRCAVLVPGLLLVLLAGCGTPPRPAAVAQVSAPPRIALALGGGAARGFAHVGVIKALEAQGIHPQIIAGSSAGSIVGALYAGGYSGFELQRLALAVDDSTLSDWSLPDRGVIKGEALQNYVNSTLSYRPIEKLMKTLAIVTTDLQSGEEIVFRSGDTGMAVRASASVPGLFQPVRINGRDYVDGALVSPVPVRVARSLGAEIVIAVDVSSSPQLAPTKSAVDVLLQAFNIMGQRIASAELPQADFVIRPDIGGIGGADFQSKHRAILEGERAAAQIMPALLERIRR